MVTSEWIAPGSRLWMDAQVASLALGLAIAATTALMIVRAYLPVPLFDQWAELTVANHWSHLFRPHNEHLLLIPRLLFIVDKAIFGGTSVFDEICTFLVQAANAGVLAVVARRARLSMAMCAGVILSALFWAYQFENFICGFQLSFIGVFAAANAAVVVLALYRERGVLPSILLGFVATLCMANGILVGVALVVLGVALRLPRRSVALLVLGAAIMILVLLTSVALAPRPVGGPPHGLSAIGDSVAHPQRILVFFLSYFGAPFARLLFRGEIGSSGALGVAALCGSAGVTLWGLLTWKSLVRWRQGAAVEFAPSALGAIMLFVAASAFVTALGRAGPYPLSEVGSGRYGTSAMIFWAVLFILAWHESRGLSWRGADSAMKIAGLMFCFVLVASQPLLIKAVLTSPAGSVDHADEGIVRHAVTYRLAQRSAGVSAILTGVYDRRIVDSLFNPTEHLSPVRIARLRASGLAPFNTAWSQWLGTPLLAHVSIGETRCPGTLNAIARVAGSAFRLAGQMAGRAAPSIVLMISNDGRVVGYGRRDPGRSLLEAIADDNPNWHGYAAGVAGRVSAYGFDSAARKVCLIGVSTVMPG